MDRDRRSSAFSDPKSVEQYAEGPPRIVPGFASLHQMTELLLAERVPDEGRVLVVGAGGGLELKTFALKHPDWTFDGVDPADEMLRLAEQTLGPLASKVRLHHGYVEDVSEGPFDGATCLLTLHFLSTEERQRTLREIHQRLKPDSPLVIAHLSFPSDQKTRTQWLARYASFAVASGVDPQKAANASQAIESHLNILPPEHEKSLLREAGFSDISLFYMGFAFRGWVAYA
ncbi:Class I SAM-dependent methyltransferase [Planctomycetales bacterium 10988]|nr:Class I SAM-dependent methyltransferase [Planctomycetales bacterium 10988]